MNLGRIALAVSGSKGSADMQVESLGHCTFLLRARM